jgi:hypothetical protein
VDKVVEAYGGMQRNNHGVEMKLFKNQLLDALEGNALYVLTSAGERARISRIRSRPKWWNR